MNLLASHYPGRRVMGLYNDGITGNSGVTLFADVTRNLYHYLSENGCSVVLVGHSQGGAVIADAISGLPRNCQEQLTIRTFGSPAINWPNATTRVVHCAFALDGITTIPRVRGIDNLHVIEVSSSGPGRLNHNFEDYLYYANQCQVP
jgi:hypothetical protein